MIAEGFPADRDIEILSVNGFVDPILRLPALIKLLIGLRDEILASGATCFVGIDSNFFNLMLAGMLRRRGVTTVHYVSPTVWAWRKGRIKKIANNVDLMMTLYPFETKIYEENNIPVEFVGHPKACEIDPVEGEQNKLTARQALGIDRNARVLAILPGSRNSEVKLTGVDFLDTASLLVNDVDQFIIPAANEKRLHQLNEMLIGYPQVRDKIKLVNGQSRQAITAADVVLVNSGTATLEAMLLRKPMVMSYRLGKISYSIVSRLVTTKWFALPNILAGRELVPEFIQDAAQPEKMASAIRELFNDDLRVDLMVEFDRIHAQLKQGSAPGQLAASAVHRMCVSR
jgi:lipid-A-disaccharide synthase